MVKVTEKYLYRKISEKPQIQRKKKGETDAQYLNRVTHLYLQSQFVDRIAPMTECSSVTVVYLQNNLLQTIHNMNNFPNLSHLYLQKNHISKIENLNCLKHLKKLYLGSNEISLVEGLDELENLMELHIESQCLLEGDTLYFDPRTIKNLGKTLKVLNISQNNLFGLHGLRDLSELEVLIANDNKIGALDDAVDTLSGLRQLRKLELVGNPVASDKKYREAVILASAPLRVLDGKEITSETRNFVENLAINKELRSRQEPKQVPRSTSGTRVAREKISSTLSGSKLFPLLKMQSASVPRTVSSFSATVLLSGRFSYGAGSHRGDVSVKNRLNKRYSAQRSYIKATHLTTVNSTFRSTLGRTQEGDRPETELERRRLELIYNESNMDVQEFRKKGKEMVDYICEYLDNLPSRRVTPNIEPGYLRPLIPPEAPEEPEDFDEIMKDVETKIMPGVTHWQHPRFHAYFPSGNSFPSILGDMLSAGIGCIGFSWAASPACTELETIVVDWFGKAIGLPNEFLALEEGSRGGGVIQTSASECVLVCMLAARAQAIKYLKEQNPCEEEGALLPKLMAYCSRESHSCVEKAAMISFVKLRILDTDDKYRLRGETLKRAMEEDAGMGLMPFFVSTTLGTTSCCSFDKLDEIGPVCKEFPHVWLHVDAAYAGNAFVCPELKPLLDGIEYADSFNTNPNKFLLTNYDCSTMWVRDRIRLTSALVVDPLYLQHGYSDAAIDYRHWGVPLSRRFRSLKLWFVLRSYGITGIRKYIRHHIKLAKKFENLVRRDPRFEVCNEVRLGLVCFRLRGSNSINEKLLSAINGSGKIHMVPASLHETYVIRFCVVAQNATEEDIDYAWKVITEYSEELLESQTLEKEPDEVMEMLDRKKKETLAYKRSFFVRMVSDPKIYNPKIAKSLPSARHQLTDPNSAVSINAPIASWISWPLAFLLQGKLEDSNEVPVRFRHLNTMVRLKGRRESSDRGDRSSPSPEDVSDSKSAPPNNNKKSPKKSPLLRHKSHKPSAN